MGSTGRIRNTVWDVAAVLTMLFAFGTVARANVTANPSFVGFGSQSVGTTSGSRNITVTNSGGNHIQISKISTSSSQFLYSGPSTPIGLNPGQRVTISVAFSPSAAQSFSGNLNIARSNGPTISVTLRGTGVAGTSSGTPPGASSGTPETIRAIAGLSFSGAAGTTLSTKSFTVSDTSPISAIFAATADQAWLSIVSASPTTVPGNAVVVAVKTAGLAPGTYTGHAIVTIPDQSGYTWTNSPYSVPVTLTISSSTAVAPTITSQPANAKVVTGQTATFNVAATGTAPIAYQWKMNGAMINGATSSTYVTPAVTMANNNAQFTVDVSNNVGDATSNPAILTVSAPTLTLNASTSSVSFGNVNVNSNSDQAVTLTNAGNGTVTISNVAATGPGFNAQGVASGTMLSPGQTATLTAIFAPASAGSVTGTISVASNATNSPDSISLSGTGVTAASHSVDLAWSPSTSAVVGYNAYSSTVSGGPYTKMTGSPVAATSYTDSAVQAGQTYFFVVTSVDSSNEESAFSNEVSATIP